MQGSGLGQLRVIIGVAVGVGYRVGVNVGRFVGVGVGRFVGIDVGYSVGVNNGCDKLEIGVDSCGIFISFG